jgi:uncharacterized protein involved in exopolysaccharide biosynthesis
MNKPQVEKIVLEVMRHFGFRRNYQVAEYFDVTPQTLSGWIKSGEIPPKHLMKYNNEVLVSNNLKNIKDSTIDDVGSISRNKKFSWNKKKQIIINNLKTLIGVPLVLTFIMIAYVFLIADPVYTSSSKVLPISENPSNQSSFSGMAAQLGINMPLTIGGTVPWDEIYPEIVKSSNLLTSVMSDNYLTKKYGNITLLEILVNENKLSNYSDLEQKNRALEELRKMIYVTKDRLSPVVTLEVAAFEPLFVSTLSKRLIEKSGQVQRELKTNRVRKKRLFIEERLTEVYADLKSMEKELREFREYNRNSTSSPSLQMQVQEMGREIDLQNSLYMTLKSKYEEAKIDEVERDDMVQIIDGPNIPSKLTSPNRSLNIVFTLFFGIFSSILIVFLRQNYIDLS